MTKKGVHLSKMGCEIISQLLGASRAEKGLLGADF